MADHLETELVVSETRAPLVLTGGVESNPVLVYLASLQPAGRRSLLARLKRK